jgi:hypothetical protein
MQRSLVGRKAALRLDRHDPRPRLIGAIHQSLTETAVLQPTASAIPDVVSPDRAETVNANERSTLEKREAALQAFAASLLQATNEHGAIRTNAPGNLPSVEGSGVNRTLQQRDNPVGNYGGLASRLEVLARELEGGAQTNGPSPALKQLTDAFQAFAQASTESGSTRSPDLKTLLTTLSRNLQSSGDPTLASTGNIINTAA